MVASYPGAIKSFTAITDAVDYPEATDINPVYDEITAIETALGINPRTGWISADQTWTYASATTITVPAGAASIYSVGDKIKLTQTTVKYFYVVAVADGLLTVTGGTDYTVANAVISENYYSKVTNPIGFPTWFTYAPTITWTAGTDPTNPTAPIYQFCMEGRRVTVNIAALVWTAGATVTQVTISMPVTPAATASASGVIQVGTTPNLSYAALVSGLGYVFSTSCSATRLQFSATYGV